MTKNLVLFSYFLCNSPVKYFSCPSAATPVLQRPSTFHEKLAVSIDPASFGLHQIRESVATQTSSAILSMTILNSSLSWLFSRLPASFFTLDLDLKGEGDGDDDKETLTF